MENKITIDLEEYKELLDYKYKWINHQCRTMIINEPQEIKNPYIYPYTPYYPTWVKTESKTSIREE